jgi:hypothetical protein
MCQNAVMKINSLRIIVYLRMTVEVEVTLRLTGSLDVEPTLGLVTRYYFLSERCRLKVAVLFLWGSLSDGRTDPYGCIIRFLDRSCTYMYVYMETFSMSC